MEKRVIFILIFLCYSHLIESSLINNQYLDESQIIPPSVHRKSVAQQSLTPLVIEEKTKSQDLVQSSQNFVDSDGDTIVVNGQRPGRGKLGSTDHLKDDQFFLNVPITGVEFNSLVNVTWVRPAGQMSKLDYIGLFFLNDTDDAIPCNWEFAPGEEGTGTVGLKMTEYGQMELRYVDAAADRPRVRLALLVYPPCSNNCTNHGICEKGQCSCFPPYKGEECCEVGGKIKVEPNVTTTLVGKTLHVKLTPPAGELDKRNWIGIFDVVPKNKTSRVDLRQQLLQTQTAAIKNSTFDDVEYINMTSTPPLVWRYVDSELDIPVPYIPGQYILKVIKNVVGERPVLGQSGIIYVHNECLNSCSGHGKCVNGTCYCEAGYDQFPDCSQGDGLVTISASPKDCIVGNLITAVWERKSNQIFSKLDYLALFDEKDTSFDAPFAYQFAQPLEEKTTPTLFQQKDGEKKLIVDRGVVYFNAPAAKGKYVVRYFKRDHTLLAASEKVDVFFDCISANCTGHGKCVKGDCICESGWKGVDCSVGDGNIKVSVPITSGAINTQVPITWSRPENVGSVYDFIAIYESSAPNDKPFMYLYASNEDAKSPNSGVLNFQLPSTPGSYEIRYIDAFSRQTIAIAENKIEVHLPCPNACSGHGTCQKQTCVCDKDWTVRDDCSAKIGITEISASPLILTTPSNGTITVVYKRPEGSGSDLDFVGIFGKSQVDNRQPISFINPKDDYGQIQLPIPQFAGIYQARYISGPNSQTAALSADIDVSPSCLNSCSQHGKCNRGTCECYNGWGGQDCSIGQGPTSVNVSPKMGHPGEKVSISYNRPVNNGGSSDFLAFYKAGQKDLSTPLSFVLATDKDRDTVETTFPVTESDVEVRYIRGTDRSSLGTSSPVKVSFACKDDCNDHGECKMGFCTCQSGWEGFACEKNVPTVFSITVDSVTVYRRDPIKVSWQAVPSQSTASDYIGLFSVSDTASNSPATFEYTSLQPTGTTVLNAPLVTGDYVVRYLGFVGGVTEVKAESKTITVLAPSKKCPKDCSGHGTCNSATGTCQCSAGWGNVDCAAKISTQWAVSTSSKQYKDSALIGVSWARPIHSDGNHLDMIGLYEAGNKAKADPVAYQYVGSGDEGSLSFKAPKVFGDKKYEVKFVNGAKGVVKAVSGEFDVKSQYLEE